MGLRTEIRVLENILKEGCCQDLHGVCPSHCHYYRSVDGGMAFGCNLEIMPTFTRDEEERRSKILARINELGYKPAYVNGDLRVINEPSELVELRERVKFFEF